MKDKREKNKRKLKSKQRDRSSDNKEIFSKVDSTNWIYNFHTITEVIHDTISSFRINCVSERYNQNLLQPKKISLGEN